MPVQLGASRVASRRPVVVRATLSNGCETDIKKNALKVSLEAGPMPLNTFNNKAPFVGKIKSVERIVGPKATGETCHIIIETAGKIPFWEGQSYGVIPPVGVGCMHAELCTVIQLAPLLCLPGAHGERGLSCTNRAPR